MKKLLVLLFAVFSFATIRAQEHLAFKGVPIDGTLDTYVANMKKAGFTYLGNEDGIALLQGDFAGFKNCTIAVVTLESMDIVNRITVVFETQFNWGNLYGNYSSLIKSMAGTANVLRSLKVIQSHVMIETECTNFIWIDADFILCGRLRMAQLNWI